MEPELLVERTDGVALLTLNRPEALNALGGDMLSLLLDALRGLAADAGIGCVVLTGAGRGFCAGQDLNDRAVAPGESVDLGHSVEIGTRAAIFGAPQHPYTRALLSAMPSADPSRRK